MAILQIAHLLLSVVHQLDMIMTRGHFTRRRHLALRFRRALAMEVSRLLHWLASTMWIWMLVMAIMKKEVRQMFKANFN
jgi:hypothetical protein